MNVPEILRAMSGSWAGVKFSTELIENAGAFPWMIPSPSLVSPSCLKASARIFSRRAVSDLSLATVKFHARYTLERLTFAFLSALRRPLEVVRQRPRGARRPRFRSTTT